MPGLFGVLTQDPNVAIGERLERAVSRLLRQPWHYAETYLAPPLGIASVQRQGRLSGGDLWASPDGNLVVAIDGELYGAPSITAADGTEHVLRYPTPRCAAHIGELYRQQGERWVAAVRGAFAVAIFDRGQEKLWLFSDRFGFRPLAYAHVDESFIMGSTMATFTAACPEAEWKLDWDAVADWFTFEHVLGEKTFLERIKLLPNGGRLCYDLKTGEITLDQYWTLDQIPTLPDIAFQEAVEESCRLFGKAVDEQAAGDIRLGVYLTSGLDSRTIVGYLKRRRPGFVTCTYGVTGCRDVVWGEALAKLVGSHHLFFPMDDGSWVFRHASEFIATAESFVSCFNSHGISTYETARDVMDVHLSGYGGGSFAGGDTTTIGALAVATSKGRAEEMYKDYVFGLGNVFRYPIERYYLFPPDVRARIGERAEASLDAEFQRYARLRPDIVGDAFTLSNRYKKMFAYLIAVERDYIEDRSPFMDYDFIDFLFSIPTKLRLHRQLQLGMLDHALPELTTVPWQVTACPPTRDPWRLRAYKLRAKVRRRMRRWFGGSPEPFEPGRNYPQWLYEHGLEWAYGILDSDRLQARGILNRAYLRELVDRVPMAMQHRPYQQQRNLAYRIGAAATFELMCRRVFDGEDGE